MRISSPPCSASPNPSNSTESPSKPIIRSTAALNVAAESSENAIASRAIQSSRVAYSAAESDIVFQPAAERRQNKAHWRKPWVHKHRNTPAPEGRQNSFYKFTPRNRLRFRESTPQKLAPASPAPRSILLCRPPPCRRGDTLPHAGSRSPQARRPRHQERLRCVPWLPCPGATG